MSVDLSDVPTPALERAREALAAGRITSPFSALDLSLAGLPAGLVSPALGTETLLFAVEAVLAERRRQERKEPVLVWTGPEGRASGARDTGVVVRELFEGARRSVLIAGFRFDHAQTLLRPLHESMRAHGVECQLFADSPDAAEFLRRHWPFGPPFPEVFADAREDAGHSSLHSKCVVVDDQRAFVTSANFTDRGQRRNVEVGVLVESPELAGRLRAQWIGLVSAGLFARVG